MRAIILDRHRGGPAESLVRCGDSAKMPRRTGERRAGARRAVVNGRLMPVLVESTSPQAGKPPGTTAIKFEVYRDGARELDYKPAAATAMGPESVPLPGE